MKIFPELSSLTLQTEPSPTVTATPDSLTINNFKTMHPDIVSYFAQITQPTKLEEVLENILQLGIMTAGTIKNKNDVDYVHKAFESLDTVFKKSLENFQSTINQDLDSAFDENGKFSNTIKQHFGEDGTMIKDLFDPHKEGSPLNIVQQEIIRHIGDLGKSVLTEKIQTETITAEHQKSPAKGYDFENWCEDKLAWISNIHSDDLEDTSRVPGSISKSKTGDFVIVLGDLKKRIVFEVKDHGRMSQKTIEDMLEKSIKNRNADYGIFVMKNVESMPPNVRWFRAYDKYLLCAVGTSDEILAEGELLHFAYKVAREKLRNAASAVNAGIDIAGITDAIHDVDTLASKLRGVKTQCTNIDKASKNIRDSAEEIQAGIKDVLKVMGNSLDDSNDVK